MIIWRLSCQLKIDRRHDRKHNEYQVFSAASVRKWSKFGLDCEVRPESTDDLLDISTAVALLWRLEQAGIDVGHRWEELPDQTQGHLDDHLLVFGDGTT